MSFAKTNQGFGRKASILALGAAALVSLVVSADAATVAQAVDAASDPISSRLLIASVLVFAAIGFVGMRLAGEYVGQLKGETEGDKPAAKKPALTVIQGSKVTLAARPLPVVGRTAPDLRTRTATSVKTAPIATAKPAKIETKTASARPTVIVGRAAPDLRARTAAPVAAKAEPARTETKRVAAASGPVTPVRGREVPTRVGVRPRA